MIKIAFLIILILITNVVKAENLDLKNYIVSDGETLENAKIAIKDSRKNGIDVIDESIFLKNNGKFGNEKNLARGRLLKNKKMSNENANMIYLQSISFGGNSNWSIIVNNTSITNKMERNVSDVVEILSVSHNSVLFKILYQKPENVEIDKKIRVIKDEQGVESLIVSLHINEFLNLSTFIISNGNMIDGSQSISEGQMITQ